MTDLRLPPQNIEIEESILASILTYPEDDLFELEPYDFYRTAHSKIYESARVIYERLQKVDITELANDLKKRNLIEEIGGISFLSKFLDFPGCIDAKYSVSQIKGYSNLRKILELSNTIAKRAYSARPEEVEEIVDIFQAEALRIGSQKNDTMVPNCDLILECIEHLEVLHKNRGMTGVPTGFSDLDNILCGFQPSDLYILAARPGMGKTAMCLNCIDYAAKNGYVSDLYSLEMARLQIAKRYLAMKSGVNSQKFRSGNFSHDDWVLITDAAERISEYPVNVDDTASSSYQEIQRKARKSKKKNKTDIIWIDYLSFLSGDRGKNTTEEIGTITRGLKQLAKELDIPIVLVSQLNRSVEQRGDKRPLLSDLRSSGEIEQDADCVIFLYRDDYYNKSEDNHRQGIVEVDVAKQRNGPTGMVKLLWHDKTTKFRNLEHGY